MVQAGKQTSLPDVVGTHQLYRPNSLRLPPWLPAQALFVEEQASVHHPTHRPEAHCELVVQASPRPFGGTQKVDAAQTEYPAPCTGAQQPLVHCELDVHMAWQALSLLMHAAPNGAWGSVWQHACVAQDSPGLLHEAGALHAP